MLLFYGSVCLSAQAVRARKTSSAAPGSASCGRQASARALFQAPPRCALARIARARIAHHDEHTRRAGPRALADLFTGRRFQRELATATRAKPLATQLRLARSTLTLTLSFGRWTLAARALHHADTTRNTRTHAHATCARARKFTTHKHKHKHKLKLSLKLKHETRDSRRRLSA